MRLLRTEYGVFAPWEALQAGQPLPPVRREPECLLVLRRAAGVELQRLPGADLAWLEALQAGATFGTAAAALPAGSQDTLGRAAGPVGRCRRRDLLRLNRAVSPAANRPSRFLIAVPLGRLAAVGCLPVNAIPVVTAEDQRLAEEFPPGQGWKKWGPYLSERQWGTVREDYSPGGTAWEYFPHDHARSRAYRWGEDGIAGLSDRTQSLCLSLALWNGRDHILKERLFGLSNGEGNHGEDVKELYYYLDATPTHSYLKMLYKYPQAAFPYERLVRENGERGVGQPELELIDTGVFDDNRYFDVFVEYAQAGPEDILMRVTAVNRGPEPAPLHLLPQLWFRNTWSWKAGGAKPQLMDVDDSEVLAEHGALGTYRLYLDGAPELLFTDNDTNVPRLYGGSASGVLQGRLPRAGRQRQHRGRGSRAPGHEDGRVVPAADRRRRQARDPRRGCAGSRCHCPSRTSTPSLPGAGPRRTSSTPVSSTGLPARRSAGCSARPSRA